MGYGAGTVDPRVDAVVADAPDPMPVAAVPSAVPLLLVQGTSDSVVPYSASQTVFGQVDAPVSYVSLIGADHLPPIAGGTPWTPVLDAAVSGFLDASVAHRGQGIGALGRGAVPLVPGPVRDQGVSGLARVGTGIPGAPRRGRCPRTPSGSVAWRA